MRGIIKRINRLWDREFNSIKDRLREFENAWTYEPEVARSLKELMKLEPSVKEPLQLLQGKVSIVSS